MDLGKTSLVKHSIRLKDNTPFKEHYQQIPSSMYEEVCKHLKEMLEIGAIWPCHSPWASMVLLVCKTDGKLWFCIDLRKLNGCTIKYSYSLPRREDTLDSFNGDVGFQTSSWAIGKSRWMRLPNHWWHSVQVHWDFMNVIVCLLNWWIPQVHSRGWWTHVWVTFSSTGVLSILMTSLYFQKCQRSSSPVECNLP